MGGSRLYSPDRRGGGGDGGLEPPGRGVSFESGVGECDRLGILKVRGEALVGVATESGLRKADWSPCSWCEILDFGGDCGGCTMTEGVSGGRESARAAVTAAGRAGERDRERSSVCRLKVATVGFGLTGGRGGAGLYSGFPFWGSGGFTGETDRGASGCGAPSSLPIFSKCESREETGLWSTVRASDEIREGSQGNSHGARHPARFRSGVP